MTGAGTTTVAYDYEGRISQITYPSSATNTFTYNGLDTRVSKVDSAGTATYKRDGAHVTAPVIGDGSAVYTPGISERRSSTTKFYGSDRLGTNSLETNTSQAVTATKTYDAFGMPVASTGSSASPFGFAGQHGYQEDTDSGLKLLGHRYYDASTGRFLTRDPIKDGRNWYSFCYNNPLKWVDENGAKPKLVIIVGKSAPGDGPINSMADDMLADAFADRYGGKYEVTVLKGPPLTDAADAIRDADAVILIGHGNGGGIRLEGSKEEGKTGDRDDSTTITPGFIRRIRGGRKLDWVIVFACGAGGSRYENEWGKVTDDFTGTAGTISIWGWLTGKDKLPRRTSGGGRRSH